jgi:hypothetical protein
VQNFDKHKTADAERSNESGVFAILRLKRWRESKRFHVIQHDAIEMYSMGCLDVT